TRFRYGAVPVVTLAWARLLGRMSALGVGHYAQVAVKEVRTHTRVRRRHLVHAGLTHQVPHDLVESPDGVLGHRTALCHDHLTGPGLCWQSRPESDGHATDRGRQRRERLHVVFGCGPLPLAV